MEVANSSTSYYKSDRCQSGDMAEDGKVCIEAAHSSTSSNPSQLAVKRKSTSSYVSMIATAILESSDSRLNLSAIYNWIEKRYPYYRGTEAPPGWRNSIRHNLSLNDCFIKVGRCEDGKGNYWSIHPSNIANFKQGDFKQRQSRRRRGRRSEGIGIVSHLAGGRQVIVDPFTSYGQPGLLEHTEDTEYRARRIHHAVSCQHNTFRQCQQVPPEYCRLYSPQQAHWCNQCHSQLQSTSAYPESQCSYWYGIPVQCGVNYNFGMGPPLTDASCRFTTRPGVNCSYTAPHDL